MLTRLWDWVRGKSNQKLREDVEEIADIARWMLQKKKEEYEEDEARENLSHRYLKEHLGTKEIKWYPTNCSRFEFQFIMHHLVLNGEALSLRPDQCCTFDTRRQMVLVGLGSYQPDIVYETGSKRSSFEAFNTVLVDNPPIQGVDKALFVMTSHTGIEPPVFILIIPRPSDEYAEQASLDATEWIRTLTSQHSPYRGAMTRVSTENLVLVRDPKFRDWEDIVPNEDLKFELDRCLHLLHNRDLYKKEVGDAKRGLILSGPPGSGKTVHVECFITECLKDNSIAVFTTHGAVNLSDVYAEAKRHAPALVVLEDIDTIVMTRGASQMFVGIPTAGANLNTLLQELEGATELDGVVTIATTNVCDSIDSALANRPGRFDRHFKFGYPNSQERLQILDLYIHEYGLRIDLRSFFESKTDLIWFVEDDGITPAFLRAAASRVRMDQLHNPETDSEEALYQAISNMKSMVNPNKEFSSPANGATGFTANPNLLGSGTF